MDKTDKETKSDKPTESKQTVLPVGSDNDSKHPLNNGEDAAQTDELSEEMAQSASFVDNIRQVNDDILQGQQLSIFDINMEMVYRNKRKDRASIKYVKKRNTVRTKADAIVEEGRKKAAIEDGILPEGGKVSDVHKTEAPKLSNEIADNSEVATTSDMNKPNDKDNDPSQTNKSDTNDTANMMTKPNYSYNDAIKAKVIQPSKRQLTEKMKQIKPSVEIYTLMYRLSVSMANYTYMILEKFPKSQKNYTGLANDIKAEVDWVLRTAIDVACYNPYNNREALLRQMSVSLKLISSLLVLSYSRGFLSGSNVQAWSNYLTNIDDMAIGLAMYYQRHPDKNQVKDGAKINIGKDRSNRRRPSSETIKSPNN